MRLFLPWAIDGVQESALARQTETMIKTFTVKFFTYRDGGIVPAALTVTRHGGNPGSRCNGELFP